MTDVGDDQFLIGSTQVLGLSSVRAYFNGLSGRHLGSSDRVRKPRHLIVYRAEAGGTADIIAVVHNRMLLSRAARRAMRDAGYFQ